MTDSRNWDGKGNRQSQRVFLLISFHPAAVLMKRRINETRELACDETVSELLFAEENSRARRTSAGAAFAQLKPQPGF
jgi:beta-lactamase regulating signal transducer with metallopeptidase domain